jgi:vancomycin resistance protein YoaR
VYVDDLPRTHDARFLIVILVIFAAALGGVYAVGYVAAGDKVPARTTVAGVDIGSKTRADARAVLERVFSKRLRDPLTVKVGGRSVKIIPQDQGVTFDVEATLDQAMGGTDWNPHHMLKVVEGGGPVDPIYRADLAALSAALAPLADRVEHPAVSSTVSVRSARPVVKPGHSGSRLDVGRAAEVVVAAVREERSSVTVPLTPVQPAVDLAEATSFVDGTLRPALSRSALVTVGGATLRVPPAQFGPALEVDDTGGKLRLTLRAGALWAHTHSLVATVPGHPVDAHIEFQDDRPVVVAGHAGTEVSEGDWADAVFAAITHSETHQAIANVTQVQPDVSTADARAFSITTNIASATGTAPARLAGALALAAKALDGTVVLPGESFSYDDVVGSASASTVLTPLGAATQTALERAHLTITQWPNVSPVGHDLGFRNSTNHPVCLHSWVAAHGAGRTAVFVQVWGTASP